MVLMRHIYGARHVLDIVEIILGSQRPRVFYQTAREIAPHIRVAAKSCLQYERERARAWRLWQAKDFGAVYEPRHPAFRRSNLQATVRRWRVYPQGALVVLKFDDLTVRVPYEEALNLHGFIDVAAQNARNWAGDGAGGIIVTGLLSDAEHNYKIGAR